MKDMISTTTATTTKTNPAKRAILIALLLSTVFIASNFGVMIFLMNGVRSKNEKKVVSYLRRALAAQTMSHYYLFSVEDREAVRVDIGEWEAIYYRADSSSCALQANSSQTMAKPLFPNGFAAGPIIDCQGQSVYECDAHAALRRSDAIKSLLNGNGFQFFLPTLTQEDSIDAQVMDRTRVSSATAVAILDSRHLAVASFSNARVYLYEYDMTKKEANLLSHVDGASMINLMDWDARQSRLTCSLHFLGAQQIFQVDLEEKTIISEKVVHAFKDVVDKQSCYESVFVPSSERVIAATTNILLQPEASMIRLFDFKEDRTVAAFLMNSSIITSGLIAKSIRFIDDQHFVAALSSDNVMVHNPACVPLKPPALKRSLGKLVLFRLDFIIDDILANNREPASSHEFAIIDAVDVGVAVLDGMSYDRGVVLLADQLNDRALMFHLDLAAAKPLRWIYNHTGYILPHGVAVSRHENLMAVTTYGDNSVFLQRLPKMASPERLYSVSQTAPRI